MTEPLTSIKIKPANKFLWAVKSYLDLISRDNFLVYGTGLKRLYVMSSGVSTLNDADIEAITAKAERDKLITSNLHGFMVSSILKNIELYGKELQRLIQARIIDISNGTVTNPEPLVKYSPEASRRNFYTPPISFVKRLQKALKDDMGGKNYTFSPPQVNLIQDVANDADSILTRLQINEGHINPTETSWGALVKTVEELIDVLEREARYAIPDQDYRVRARGALKILWFIGKLLLGDLTIRPLAKDLNLIDLDKQLNLSDGTLASIPFPLKETVTLFSDNDGRGLTMKGHTYLSAVSAAGFYRGEFEQVTE